MNERTIHGNTGTPIGDKVLGVKSVNNKTGAVNLTAEDVGALPSDTPIPSIEGLATETYVDDAIAAIDLPTGDNWELIEDITLTEEVGGYGEYDLNLKKVVLICNIVGTATNGETNTGIAFFKINGAEISNNNVGVKKAGNKAYCQFFVEALGKNMRCESSTQGDNPIHNNSYKTGYNSTSGNITSVKYYISQTQYKFGVGSRFLLYGVRA